MTSKQIVDAAAALLAGNNPFNSLNGDFFPNTASRASAHTFTAQEPPLDLLRRPDGVWDLPE